MIAASFGLVSSVAGRTGDVTLAVADVGGAAPLDSPSFTGSPTALNPLSSDNSTRLATTAFVKAQGYFASGGAAGGQTGTGGTGAGENLTLVSTAHATRGKILFGTSAYDEVNNRLAVGSNAPRGRLDLIGAVTASGNYGFLSLGPATTSFDGSTSGFFFGSSSGTYLAVNGSSFAGDFVNIQNGGRLRGVLKLTSSGRLILGPIDNNVDSGGVTPTVELYGSNGAFLGSLNTDSVGGDPGTLVIRTGGELKVTGSNGSIAAGTTLTIKGCATTTYSTNGIFNWNGNLNITNGGVMNWVETSTSKTVMSLNYSTAQKLTVNTQTQITAPSDTTKAFVLRPFSTTASESLFECQTWDGATTVGFRLSANGTPSCPSPNNNSGSERFGAGATGNAAFSTSIGNLANAGGTNSTAVGQGATVSGHIGSIALGCGATTTAANQLMIGSANPRINQITLGGAVPIADTAAVNNSLFVGSDHSNSLCWKDGSGVVHTLY